MTIIGCKKADYSDSVESFYGKYELSHVYCNYYSGGTSRSVTYINPPERLILGSVEQNEFYSEVYNFLGAYLTFENKYITFGGKYPVEYSYYNMSDDGSFRFSFNNVFIVEDGTVRKFMNSGRTSVWLDYVNNTVKGRQITVSSELYVEGQGALDFKPVAVFEFVFANNKQQVAAVLKTQGSSLKSHNFAPRNNRGSNLCYFLYYGATGNIQFELYYEIGIVSLFFNI